MAGQHNIWSRLQDHEILPPQGVYENLLTFLQQAGEGDGPAPASSLPLPGTDMPGDNRNDQPGIFGRLGSHEVPPPPHLRLSIERRIDASLSVTGNSTATGNSSIPGKRILLYRSMAVAACLLVIVAGWFFYKSTGSGKHLPAPTETTGLASSQKTMPVAPSDSLSKADSLNPSLRDSNENKTLAGGPGANDNNKIAKTARNRTQLSFSIEGQPLPIKDNDLLASFASFTYTEVPAFINKSNKDNWKVRIDQYTSILISKPIVEMMKEMNTFKSSGELTRKARKARERLDKWKKTDESQFDQGLKHNPLDPIDLGDFIFK